MSSFAMMLGRNARCCLLPGRVAATGVYMQNRGASTKNQGGPQQARSLGSIRSLHRPVHENARSYQRTSGVGPQAARVHPLHAKCRRHHCRGGHDRPGRGPQCLAGAAGASRPDGTARHSRCRSGAQRTGPVHGALWRHPVGYLGPLPAPALALARAVGHEQAADPQSTPDLSRPDPVSDYPRWPRLPEHDRTGRRRRRWPPLAARAGRRH
ncbi:hypothetical protein D3C85_1073720 [compost metagenome]